MLAYTKTRTLPRASSPYFNGLNRDTAGILLPFYRARRHSAWTAAPCAGHGGWRAQEASGKDRMGETPVSLCW